MSLYQQQHPRHWWYDEDEVVNGNCFYWVGRGGRALTHKINSSVRSKISSVVGKYALIPKHQKDAFAKSLLQNVFKDVKFVISRDRILAQLEEDDWNEQYPHKDLPPPKKTGRRKKKASTGRNVGESRRRSLLNLHHSIEQIQSYKEGTYIEVGYEWSLDVIKHLLREVPGRKHSAEDIIGDEASISSISTSMSSSSSYSAGSATSGLCHHQSLFFEETSLVGHKRKHNRQKMATTETPVTLADTKTKPTTQSFPDLGEIFDHPLPTGTDVDSMFQLLFPEESGGDCQLVDEELCRSKKQRTSKEPFVSSSSLGLGIESPPAPGYSITTTAEEMTIEQLILNNNDYGMVLNDEEEEVLVSWILDDTSNAT